MLVLGIETSCDETAAAVVSSERRILSNVVYSQTTEHLAYGGVVPEIAARSHIEQIEPIIQRAMQQAGMDFSALDGIATTGGPGLIGGVLVGVMTAKAIASVHRKPFIAVNHLEGHALTVRLTDNVSFPYLLLLASGGHCQFLVARGVGDYVRLGGTKDDALGEAFDKTAKMLGLGYPGGPVVERLAKQGNERAYTFPMPLKGQAGCDLSFSGLKTSVRLKTTELQSQQALGAQTIADLCASFQYTATHSVVERSTNAIGMFKALCPEGKTFVIAGGVAANRYLRDKLENLCTSYDLQLIAPPVALCTDNAAMIAWAGIERLQQGETTSLTFEARARWPLADAANP